MKQLLSANMRTHWQRYLAAAVSIALASAFIIVCFGLVGGINSSIERNLSEETRGSDLVLRNQDASLNEVNRDVSKLAANQKVEAVSARVNTGISITRSGITSYGQVRSYPQAPFTAPQLESGLSPTRAHEAAIIRPFADALRVSVGDSLRLTTFDGNDIEVKITGITKAGAMSFNAIYLTESDIATLKVPASIIVVKGNASVSDVKDLLGSEAKKYEIRTQADDLNEQVKAMSGQQTPFFVVLMIFPAIAAITAIIVISTTFQVMLTQRQRELALLRAIGAGRNQVKRLVVLETLTVGAISAALGTALGIGASVLLNVYAGISDSAGEAFSSISPLQVLVTFLIGILIAFVAGYGPARRASALSPMRALNADESVSTRHKRHWVRSGLGTVLVGTSAIMIAFSREQISTGNGETAFVLAFFGGLIGFIGALLLLSFLAAHFTLWLSKIFARRSVTTALAGENTYRNPGRTGATITALVLGVTLVTMLMVGASSMEKTLNQGLVQARPLDLVVESAEPLSESQVNSLQKMEHIAATTTVEGFTVPAQIDRQDGSKKTAITVYRSTDLGSTSHAEVVLPKPGEIAVNGYLWKEGDQKVTITLGQRTWEFKPVVSKTAGYTLAPSDFDQISAALPAQPAANAAAGSQDVNPGRGIRVVYMKFATDTNTSQASTATQEVAKIAPNSQPSGGGYERIMMLDLINSIMLGALAMLAVSVGVALVGVSNTLSLSVIERKRENSLLRAIGMTRSGMRTMLVLEAILLSVVALAFGFALGIGFGWLGVLSLPIEGVAPILDIPWWQLTGVAFVTLLAAVLASVLPGRRAARSAPVEALAQA